MLEEPFISLLGAFMLCSNSILVKDALLSFSLDYLLLLCFLLIFIIVVIIVVVAHLSLGQLAGEAEWQVFYDTCILSLEL